MNLRLPDIDFSLIRPFRGKQADGFEELSVQLFRGETESNGDFFRIEGAGGDGGVEAYRKLADGKKIAVQSKYFDRLGNTQWNQITKSVKTALENHPTLLRYFIATPLNRTPVQTKRWEKLTSEWLDYAKSLEITHTIEFVWWGNSELTGLLTKECYRNQLTYWLGLPNFNAEWLARVNRANIELLGKRYSPKQHIETDSGIRLEAFAWSEEGKERTLNAFLQVAEQWRKVDRRETALAKSAVESKELTQSLQTAMREIKAFRWPDSGYPAIRPLNKLCRKTVDRCHELKWKLRELNIAAKEKKAEETGARSAYQSGPYESLIHDLHNLSEAIASLLDATNVCQFADDSKLLLLGDAGSGKSHLIGDLVTTATARAQPALLLLGEQYLGNGDPWTASTEALGWIHSADDLLAALDQEALLTGRPALLCIDALNESEHRRLWQSHLIQFAERTSCFPHVKLLVSCRADFARITLPESVRPGSTTAWPSFTHQGFGAEVIEAIEVYFKEFGVRAAYFPPALTEFKNPLFLRVFCEAFEGQALPTGPLGFDRVMRARLDRLCTQIQREIDCDAEDTRAALQSIAKEIADNGGRPIPRKTAKTRTEEHFPNRGSSSSLYGRLLSNGMLVETVRYSPHSIEEPEVTVRFPFERFSDYFIATYILQKVHSAEEFKELFEKDGRLEFLRDNWQYYENRGVARALAILAPERLNLELADVLTTSAIRDLLLEDFLESLVWRSGDSISKASEALLAEASEAEIDLLPTYLRVSTIPHHPFNSEYLGNRLKSLPLPERELAWTIPVAELSSWDDGGILGDFLHWCFRAPTHLIPDDQTLLASRLLLWFCTSNHRALRKRSSLAAIRLLVGRPQVVCQLVSEFQSIDDPYLLERLYAAAAGVAMRLPAGNGLSALAGTVHSTIFAHDKITPNILIRDFASRVLEACLAKKCLPKGINPESFRPPFNSDWPVIPSEDDVKRFENDNAWREIVSSVRSEGMGGYGDFGRYVMDADVHNFSDKLRSEPMPSPEYRGEFKGKTARRWILGRVEELGWSGERFGKYEDHVPHGRQSSDIEELKIERISKKYQWIGLREFLGFLSDHYWLNQSWKSEPEEFVGAWQLWAREFDPSQRFVDVGAEEEIPSEAAVHLNYPSPFQYADLCEDREAWVTRLPDDFSTLLAPSKGIPDSSKRWLTLSGHCRWVEPEYDRVISGRRGTLKMWVDIRSFLVRKEEKTTFLNQARKRHFYGHGCGFPEEHSGWIGEYPWGEVYNELKYQCEHPDARVGKVGVPYTITTCHWSKGSTLIPSPQLCDLLDLEWASEGGRFSTRGGEAIIEQLGGDGADWGRPLLVRQDSLRAALDAEGMELVWCVIAERSCWCSETITHIVKKELELSAVYWLEKNTVQGGFTQTVVQTLH